MRVRWIGLVCALFVVAAAAGAVAGHAVGRDRRPQPTTFASARPLAAASPSAPVAPIAPYDPDIDYPPLATDLRYRRQLTGTPGYRWRYDVPRGWVSSFEGPLEPRWRPRGEPTTGGYSLRVKIINEHLTNEQMVAQKVAAVTSSYQDVTITQHASDRLSFQYRDPTTNRKRFNTFLWITPTGSATAEFEMSVVGREADVAGLAALFEHVGSSVHKLP